MKNYRYIKILLIVFSIILISAIVYLKEKKSTVNITVFFKSQVEMLKSDFISEYERIFPDEKVEIEYILDDIDSSFSFENWDKAIEDYIDNNKVDVLYGFEIEELEKLIKDGYLCNLDEYISKFNFPIENITESSINSIREASNKNNIDGLFALSPTFNNGIIIYNKDIFDKFGVEYPDSELTWESLISVCENLKEKVPNNISILGFGPLGLSGAYTDFQQFIYPIYSQYVENDIIINEENYFNLWSYYIDIYNKYSLNYTDGDDFINGYCCIRVIYPPELREFNKYIGKDVIKNNSIGTSTFPIFKNINGYGISKASALMAISSNSNRKYSAWKLIEYANGKEYAKHYVKTVQKVRSFGGGIPSYVDDDIIELLNNLNGVDSSVFYSGKSKLISSSILTSEEIIECDILANDIMYNSIKNNKIEHLDLEPLINKIQEYIE